MNDNRQIIIEEAHYLLDHKTTVRDAGKYFCRGKSTIHLDMRTKLPYIDRHLATEVGKLLDLNMEERAMRGGIATQKKYAKN